MDEKFKKVLSGILIVAGILFLFSQFVFGVAPEELKNSIEQKSKELEEINNKIKDNQRILEEVQGRGSTLKQEINRVDSTISQLNLGIQASQVNISRLGLELESLQYDISDAEGEIDLKRRAIAEILRQFQQREEETPLILFLRNKTLADGVFEVQSLSDLNNGLSIEV